jgi:hypothetical protein
VRTLRSIPLSLLFLLWVAPAASAQINPTPVKPLTVRDAWAGIAQAVDVAVTDAAKNDVKNRWSRGIDVLFQQIEIAVRNMRYEDAILLLESVADLPTDNSNMKIKKTTQKYLERQLSETDAQQKINNWKLFLGGTKNRILHILADIGDKRAWRKVAEHVFDDGVKDGVKDRQGSTVGETATKLVLFGSSPEKIEALQELQIDPNGDAITWRTYAALEENLGKYTHESIVERFLEMAKEKVLARIASADEVEKVVQVSRDAQATWSTHYLPLPDGTYIAVPQANAQILFELLKGASDFATPSNEVPATLATYFASLEAPAEALQSWTTVVWKPGSNQKGSINFARYLEANGQPVEIISGYPGTTDPAQIFSELENNPKEMSPTTRLDLLRSTLETTKKGQDPMIAMMRTRRAMEIVRIAVRELRE